MGRYGYVKLELVAILALFVYFVAFFILPALAYGPMKKGNQNPECLTDEQESKCPSGFQGHAPHCENCQKFFVCQNDVKINLTCPNGTYFDYNFHKCTQDPSETCKTKGNCECAYYDDEPTCLRIGDKCSGKYRHYPSCSDCSSYFQCPIGSKGKPAVRSVCTEYKYYDIGYKKCTEKPVKTCKDVASNCTCNYRPYGYCMSEGPESKCPNGNIIVPVCLSCHKYYECYKGKSSRHLHHCQQGTYFDVSRLVCVFHPYETCRNYDDNCDCSYREEPECLEKGDLCGEEEIYPDCKSCTAFHVCKDSKGKPSTVQECPEGQFLDWENKTCMEHPESTCQQFGTCNCTYKPPPEPVEPPCLNGSETCSGKNHIYPDCNHCEYFHTCKGAGSTAVREVCPEKQYFDYDLKKCDHMPNTTCKVYTNCSCPYDPGYDPPCLSEGDLCTGLSQFYPSCEDCETHYICGKRGEPPKKQTCPPKTFYDLYLRTCMAHPIETCQVVAPACKCPYDPGYTDPVCMSGGEVCYPYTNTTIFGNCLDCYSFFDCKKPGQNATKEICPDGTFYDFPTKKCSANATVTCEALPGGCDCFRGIDEDFCLTATNRTCPEKYNGSYPDCEDCRFYHICNGTVGESDRTVCSKGKYFDWMMKSCEKMPAETCKQHTNCTCPYPPDLPPEACLNGTQKCPMAGRFPSCDYCRQYFECRFPFDKPLRKQCPDDEEYFDWGRRRCTDNPGMTCADFTNCSCVEDGDSCESGEDCDTEEPPDPGPITTPDPNPPPTTTEDPFPEPTTPDPNPTTPGPGPDPVPDPENNRTDCLRRGDRCPPKVDINYPDCDSCHQFFKCEFEGDKVPPPLECRDGTYFDWWLRICVENPFQTCWDFTNCTCNTTGSDPETNNTICPCTIRQIIARQSEFYDLTDINLIEQIPGTSLLTGIDYNIYSAEYPEYRWKLNVVTYSDGSEKSYIQAEKPDGDQQLCDPCAQFRFFRARDDNVTLNRLHLLNRCGNVSGNSSDYKSLVMPYNDGCIPGREGMIQTAFVNISKPDNFYCEDRESVARNFYCEQTELLNLTLIEEDNLFYLGHEIDNADNFTMKDFKKYIYVPSPSPSGRLSTLQFYETGDYLLQDKFIFSHTIQASCDCDPIVEILPIPTS